MNYEIQNIPPPIASFTPPAPTEVVYPFAQLQETQSFVVGAEHKDAFKKIRSAASYYSRTNGVWLRCYTLENGSLQVYRDLDSSGKKGGGRKSSKAVPDAPVAPQAPAITVSNPPVVLAAPPAPPVPTVAGPTHDQWCNMLAKMQLPNGDNLSSITITREYKSLFPQMQAWTTDYGAATQRRYSALVVGGELSVIRGQDIDNSFEFNAELPTDAIESEADNAEVIVVSTQTELPPVSAANDGWTGRPCKQCSGTGEGTETKCPYCAGTGEEYIAALDLRTQVPVPASAATPVKDQTLASIAAAINKQANQTVLLDGKPEIYY